MTAERGDGADRQTIIGADQRREIRPPRKQFLGARFAFLLVEAGGEGDQRRVRVEAERGAMALEGAVALDAGRHRLWAGDIGDAAVSEAGEVAEHVEDSAVLVIDDGGYRIVLDAPVDGDDRHSVCGQARYRLVLALDACQDQSVDPARTQEIGDLGLAVEAAVRVGQHRKITVLRQGVLDAADDGREHRVGDVGNDDADRAGAICLQRQGGGVRPVVEALADAHDILDHLRPDQMARTGIERARDRRDVNAGLPCDILQSDTAVSF